MIKLKSTIVIVLSSILISAVILFTILGLSLYLTWRGNESSRLHTAKLVSLNEAVYNKYISVQDLKAEYAAKGLYKGKSLLKGTIKNSGYRTISSIKLSVEFLNKAGETIYTENIFPLKTAVAPSKPTIAALSLFTSGKEVPLLPGESIRLNHILSQQKHKNIISPIKNKRYATNPNEWSGKFSHKITAIGF